MALPTNEENWSSGFDLKAHDNRTKSSPKGSNNVLIGEGCRVSGQLNLQGDARIDGIIDGEILSAGELMIGESGIIEGQIQGVIVRVFGRVNGDINATTRIELNSGAQVFGNITSPGLVIQDGVVFEGYCRMNRETANSAAQVQGQGLGQSISRERMEDVVELGSPSAPAQSGLFGSTGLGK